MLELVNAGNYVGGIEVLKTQQSSIQTGMHGDRCVEISAHTQS